MTICNVSGRHRYAILSGESIKGGQSVAAPLASGFFKSDHLHLSISHFWPFNVVKCCQQNSLTMALNIGKKHGIPTNWPNIATKFAKRGTVRRLLLLNGSSWRRAASATLLMESGTLGDSGTPGCNASDVARLRQLLGSGLLCYH